MGLFTAVVLCGGCGMVQPFHAHLRSESPQVRGCADWYRALDAETAAAGVRDPEQARLPGMPYARIDRFFASLTSRAASNQRALATFAERLNELDLQARRHEIDNLPLARVERLPGIVSENGRALALRRTLECGRLLREIDLALPAGRAALIGARAPGASSSPTILPSIGHVPTSDEGARRIRYAPPAALAVGRDAVAGILGRAELDPLGQPVLSERELALLGAHYAPILEIAVRGDVDRFGALRWSVASSVPHVDASELAVYLHTAYARYGERILLQLVYTIWFPGRPHPSDAHAGALDGLAWRVTLAPDGAPLLYEALRTCDASMRFFPTPGAVARDVQVVSQALPAVEQGERPRLVLSSGMHDIEHVAVARDAETLVRYELHSYEALRSMRDVAGGSRSAFAPDGKVVGTGRSGRACAGRARHDDPHLFERHFGARLAGATP